MFVVGTTPSSATERPMRADARRNRVKLIEAAREVFREGGSEASLDDVAKRAGVGPGTLYRHFPTRDDLIDAVMRDWSVRIEADAESAAADPRPAREVLRDWFGRFVDNVGIYRGAAAKLMSAMDDESSPIYRKCQVLIAANANVLGRLADRGELRDGIDDREVMRLISGVASVADNVGLSTVEASGMIDIVITGIVEPGGR
ncbi:TetR/AcrR family transcriptional regulator [Gordonia effusa]|nr:TetR/AcrR family transcriptional regulator [Gordonia effusa]